MTITSDEIKAIHAAEVARLSAMGDPCVALNAWRGTRTLVHERMQAELPMPTNEDPDTEHALQTVHFEKLWKKTDEAVKLAGLKSPEGGA